MIASEPPKRILLVDNQSGLNATHSWFLRPGTHSVASAEAGTVKSTGGVRQNSSFGRGVPPGRPDASARRPYHIHEEFCLTPKHGWLDFSILISHSAVVC